jgi:hypothetical protein
MNEKVKGIVNMLFKVAFTFNIVVSVLSTIILYVSRNTIPKMVYVNYSLLLLVGLLIYVGDLGEKK